MKTLALLAVLMSIVGGSRSCDAINRGRPHTPPGVEHASVYVPAEHSGRIVF